MENISNKSKGIKLEADRILNESGLLDILKDYGEVKIAGSHALDVMLRPDIDIYVVTEKHDWDKVKKIYSKIMESKYFREFDFVNWLDFDGVPNVDVWSPSIKGYYLRPVIATESELWKMDIWLITPEYDKSAERTDHYKKLLDEAGESKRKIILEIKDATRKDSTYIPGVDGKLIYKAVLEDNINTPEEFLLYLRDKN